MKYGIQQGRRDTILWLKCTISKEILGLNLLRNAIAAVIVFDVTSRESFEKC